MVHHFINFIFRTLETMPSRVGSNWGGVIFTVVLFGITEFVLWMWGDLNRRWTRNALIGLGGVALGWLGLFIISVFLAGYDDHQNLVGASHRIKEQAGAMAQPLREELTTCKTSNEVKGAVNQTLQSQNRDQQSTINGCLSQAIKLLTPEPEKMTVLGFDSDNAKPVSTTRWIVLTNRTITPARIDLICPNVIESVSARIIGETVTHTVQPIRLSPNSWRVEIISPAWTPTSPMLMTASWRGNDNGPCTFRKF